MHDVSSGLTADDVLDGHRRAQRVAYDAALEVASSLRAGVTEKEAAAALGRRLSDRGVRRYFHQPFAWFGDRSAFAGFGGASPRFLPSERRLEEGMVGILDVAPVVDGFAADIGYTFVCGAGDERLERAMQTLAEIRALIPRHVARGDTMRSIYVRIDRLLAERGFDNRHARYPFGVLGHRIWQHHRLPAEPRVMGFGLSAATKLLGGELVSRWPLRLRPSPLWSNAESSNRPAEHGLWAIEPHLGCDGFGAKFEELLVVGPDGAHWLDDDVPHVRGLAATA